MLSRTSQGIITKLESFEMYLRFFFKLFFRKVEQTTFATKMDMFCVYPAGLMKLLYAKLPFAKLMGHLAKMEIALDQADVNVRWDGKFSSQK